MKRCRITDGSFVDPSGAVFAVGGEVTVADEVFESNRHKLVELQPKPAAAADYEEDLDRS